MPNSGTLLLVRCFVFGGVIAISLVVIEVEGYAANVIANTEWAPISRISRVISQLTVVSLSAMAFSSTGSFLNTILFEIIWFAILSTLWLATAALISSQWLLLQQTLGPDGCYALDGAFQSICWDLPAIEGLALVTALLLMLYIVVLSVFASKAIEQAFETSADLHRSEVPDTMHMCRPRDVRLHE